MRSTSTRRTVGRSAAACVLNYGLRYEMTTRIRERSAQTSSLDFYTLNGKPAVNLSDQSRSSVPVGSGRVRPAPGGGVSRREGHAGSRRRRHHHDPHQPLAEQRADRRYAVRGVSAPDRGAGPADPIRNDDHSAAIADRVRPPAGSRCSPPAIRNRCRATRSWTCSASRTNWRHFRPITASRRSTAPPSRGTLSNGYIGTWTMGIEQKIQRRYGERVVRRHGRRQTDRGGQSQWLHRRDTRVCPLYAVRCGRPDHRRLRSHLPGRQSRAFHVSRAPGFGIEQSDGVGPGRAGELFVVEVASTTSAASLGATSAQDPFHTSLERGPSTLRRDAGDELQPVSGSACGPRTRAAAAGQEGDGRLADAGDRQREHGPAVHGAAPASNRPAPGRAARTDRTRSVRRCSRPSRTVREDYFGLGDNNASYFSIPIHVAGGTGPNEGRSGTLGRNTFRGPMFHNFDVAFIKDTPLAMRNGRERASLQFRGEFFNVFNLVNFGLPQNTLLGRGVRADQQDGRARRGRSSSR